MEIKITVKTNQLKNNRPVIRPATREDILHFNDSLDKTVRAWAIEYNGKLAAIAGVQRQSPRILLIFSHMDKDVEAPDITVWRTTLKVFEKIKDIGLPLIAIPDENIKTAPLFLERLGFQPYEGFYGYDI